MLKNKDLLGLKGVSKEEINVILKTAAEMKKIIISGNKKSDLFAGKSMATLFYENSTRTRSSFEMACNYLGGTFSSLNVATSSVNKGETLGDTARTLDAFGTDILVIRHGSSGAPHLIADKVKASVINAGDGSNEHPTQALLDMFTLQEKFGELKGLELALIGDIRFSRVARSNIWGLTEMGVKVRVFGPGTLSPIGFEHIKGVKICHSMEEALKGADAIMALRLQKERMESGLLPSLSEFSEFFGINENNINLAKTNAMLMHPGPVNRNVELSDGVLLSPKNFIDRQVTNGVAIRMALMYLLTKDRGNCGR